MKRTLITVILLTSFRVYAQNVGVNNTGVAPDNSAMLDVVSTDKGMLVPRVNIIDLNTAAPVTAPANSLLVYNTNATSGVGFYFWDGTKWTKLADANSNSDEDWYEVGGTTAPDNINDDVFTQGNVGIGTTTPGSKLFIKQATDDTPASSLRVENSGGTAGSLLTVTSDNKTYLGAQSAFDGPGANVDNGVYIANNSGNVGIGTINPLVKLQITSDPIGDNLNDEQDLLLLHTAPTGNNLFLEVKNKRHIAGTDWTGTNTRMQRRVDGTPQAFIDFGVEGISGSYGLGFGTRNGLGGTQQTRMVIDGDGNVGINTTTPSEKLDVVGDVSVGTHVGLKIHNSFGNSLGAGPRELFRISNSSLSTGGFFTISATRGNFVHNSTWSWSSNHHSLGRGMLTQLSGGSYSDIHVYLDVNSSGNAIISADWGIAQGYSLSIVNMSGSDDLNINSVGTDWTIPAGGYTRVSDVETKAYAFQSVNGLFSGNLGVGTVTPTSKLHVVGLQEFADNAAALAGGLTIGAFYRTGDLLKVVH